MWTKVLINQRRIVKHQLTDVISTNFANFPLFRASSKHGAKYIACTRIGWQIVSVKFDVWNIRVCEVYRLSMPDIKFYSNNST